jgi:hypothetical protein
MARSARRLVAIVTITVGCASALYSAPAIHAGGVSGTGGPLKGATVASVLVTMNGGISGTGGPLSS